MMGITEDNLEHWKEIQNYKQFKQILGDLEYDLTKDNMSRILRGAYRYIEIEQYLYVVGVEEKISKDIIECGERMKMSEFYKMLEEVKKWS